MKTNIWECKCGHIEYGEFPPEECNSCWSTNDFFEVPEDRIEALKDNVIEKIRATDYENEEEDDDY